MNRRSFFLALIFFLLALIAWLLWSFRADTAKQAAAPDMAVRPPAAETARLGPMAGSTTAAAAPQPAEERIALADPLNARGGDIRSDLRVLNDIFQAWLTNFPRDGNPVGENREITAALSGDNSLRLSLIGRDHPAINRRGEICDRWGTPFRFHQLSGSRMEIHSAGPDRMFATADDEKLTP